MRLGVFYWAKLDKVYYANNKHDPAAIGFGDKFIYAELELDVSDRKLQSKILLPEEAIQALKDWDHKKNKTVY